MRNRGMGAFTLVEMMIVVAIIGILGAIAIPALSEMQLRAKLAEVPLNCEGIAKAVYAGTLSRDDGLTYDADIHPRDTGDLDKTAHPWAPVPADWWFVGWEPDGLVRCSYDAWTNAFADGTPYGVGRAYCDLDDDDWFYSASWSAPTLNTDGGGKCGDGLTFACARGTPGCECA